MLSGVLKKWQLRLFFGFMHLFANLVVEFFGTPISFVLLTNQSIDMGKGDKKTKRGKIANGTYGRRRQSNKKRKKKLEAANQVNTDKQ